MDRAGTAAKRVSKTYGIIRKLRNALVVDEENNSCGAAGAVVIEDAAGKMYVALELARAESSTSRKRLVGFGRPRQMFN